MIDFDEVEEADIDSALPPELGQLAAPAPLTFAPWHRPRKQFVRTYQWVHHAEHTLRRMKADGFLDDGATISYLTLPGPDMIDVRMIAEVCNREGHNLKYTGFCSVNEDESSRLRQNIAMFQTDFGVKLAPGCSVYPYRLEEIAHQKSAAREMFQRQGPYHVINIDACSPLMNEGPDGAVRLIDAIKEIISSQINRVRHPWLLYITTPVQTDSVDPGAIGSLRREIELNCAESEEFERRLAERYSADEDFDRFVARSTQNNGMPFCSFFALGLAKWMLHLTATGSFDIIKMKSFCYSLVRREPAFPNMLSTAYLFNPKPIQVADVSGLTRTGKGQQIQTSRAKSSHIIALEKAFSLQDVDVALVQDNKLFESLANETQSILRELGYNVLDPETGYAAWLQAEGQSLVAEGV